MSTLERLKELEAKIKDIDVDYLPYPHAGDASKVFDAYPKLLTVVEAAKKFVDVYDGGGEAFLELAAALDEL